MRSLNVLVVDDDRDFAESLAEALELQGHRAVAALSGDEGIQRFRETDYDVAFMDVRMPGRDGVESFLEIRRIRPQAKVIMMTGFSVEQLLDKAVENGAWGVLHKPLNMQQVSVMLERIRPAGILIADDEPDFVASLRDILELQHYVVYTAGNSSEAVERVCAGGIDVLILDLHLPIVGGLEVFMELRRRGRAVPTIIVTGYADEDAETLSRLSSFKVSGILTKPFDTRALLRAIESLVA